MRLHESLLNELLWLEWVDTNVSNFITAGKLRAIWADSYASDRVYHVIKIDTALVLQIQKLSIFASIKRTCFEVIKGSLRGGFISCSFAWLSQRARDKDHLAHVFAVGVLCKALIDLLILLLSHARVDKIPESNRSIWRTSDELRQVVLIFAAEAWSRFLVKTNLDFVFDYLDVVDRSAVRVHAAQDGNRFQIWDIPYKHHAVWVKSDCTIVDSVNSASNDIGKLISLVLLNLDTSIASK